MSAGIQMLADLQEAINDEAALLANPEARKQLLTELVKTAYQLGVIDTTDQHEYLEWVDSAHGWAVEELNQPESRL
jgi:hypothetical protein